MNIQLITAKEEQISPEVISEELQQIVDMMAGSDMQNKQTMCIYNILCGVCCLLKRYETVSRETLLAAALEEDDKELRKHISLLHKNALYQKLFVPQIMSEDMDI